MIQRQENPLNLHMGGSGHNKPHPLHGYDNMCGVMMRNAGCHRSTGAGSEHRLRYEARFPNV